MAETDFERIGGEPALRAIIDEFVERVFGDVMIGFLFRRANPERLRRHEYEHAARHLGAGVEYEGRPLRQAHAPHPIMGGHFDRRSTILRRVLESHGVPSEVCDRWLAHVESLRSEITGDRSGECNDARASRRVP